LVGALRVKIRWYNLPFVFHLLFLLLNTAFISLQSTSSEAIRELQMLFARMQMGNKKWVSPKVLCHLLNLKTGVQQDIQEYDLLLRFHYFHSFDSPSSLTVTTHLCLNYLFNRFNKLFLSFLEEQFAGSHQSELKSLLSDQFSAKHCYITTCKKCGSVSKRFGAYNELELHIKDKSTLDQCLEEYIKVEELTDDNRYDCATCQVSGR
jgi:ubiquitin C-terminal hydrolase